MEVDVPSAISHVDSNVKEVKEVSPPPTSSDTRVEHVDAAMEPEMDVDSDFEMPDIVDDEPDSESNTR